MQQLMPYVVSILLGFLIGLDREKSRAPGGSMGIRTFTLIAILGTVAGTAEVWLATLLGSFALGLVLLSYYRETGLGKAADRGLTTEVAAGLVFALSFGSHQNPALAALLGTVVAMVLFWKRPLHRFTAQVSRRELEAALIILLLALSVLSFLEDKAIDPWGVFNPRKFGMVALALAAIEFSSYLAAKYLGRRKSSVLIGFLAGLVSSTALVFSTIKLSHEKPEAWRYHVSTTLVGQIASLLELIVVVTVVSSGLYQNVTLLLLLPMLSGTGISAWLLRSGPREESPLEVKSPLDLFGILRLSLLLALILGAVGLAQQQLGDVGRNTAVLIAGVIELHGGSMAAATLFEHDQIDMRSLLVTIGLAVLSSLAAKMIFVSSLARGNFRKAFVGSYALLMAATAVSLLLIGSLVPA